MNSKKIRLKMAGVLHGPSTRCVGALCWFAADRLETSGINFLSTPLDRVGQFCLSASERLLGVNR